MVICLERGADLHMAQLMLLPLTVSCFSKIQIRFTFLVLAHPGSPGKSVVKRVYVCNEAELDLEIDRVERIDSTRLKIDQLDRLTRLYSIDSTRLKINRLHRLKRLASHCL